MHSPDTVSRLRDFKDLLFILAVIYFYAIGTLLLFHWPTYGLASAPVFLSVGFIFLAAFAVEMLLSWWNRRRWFLSAILGAATYGVLALYLAPLLYGQWILTYALLEPLVIVFVGGLAFVYGKILADILYASKPLTQEDITRAVKNMPGWSYVNETLHKTYSFSTKELAQDFSLLVERLGKKRHHPAQVNLSVTHVEVTLRTARPRSVTRLDLALANEIDAM